MNQEELQRVEKYLELLDAGGGSSSAKPKEVERKLNQINKKLRSAKGVKRLNLLQQREDIARVRASAQRSLAAEAEFVDLLAHYAEQTGTSYTTLREFGLSRELLVRAGVPRTRRTAPVREPSGA